MFDEKEAEAYRKITAPPELKDKVMAAGAGTAAAAKHRSVTVYRAAACIAVFLVLAVFWDWNSSGAVIREPEAIITASRNARTALPAGIAVTVTTRHSRNITVSCGTLCSSDPVTGEVLETGTEIRIRGTSELFWEVDPAEEECRMQITGWGKDRTFLLVPGQEPGTWTLEEEQSHR